MIDSEKLHDARTRKQPEYRLLMWLLIVLSTALWLEVLIGRHNDVLNRAISMTVLAFVVIGAVAVQRRNRKLKP